MKQFITSDLHFFHKNIIKFCPQTRGSYANVDDMANKMIQEWNATVSHKDHTYILGDFAFCGAEQAAAILKQLNGTKTLIVGNHDDRLVKHWEFCDEFVQVTHYLAIQHNEHHVAMMHYPIAKWDRQHYGSLHFHGHMHGKPTGLEGLRAMDVGFDATGFVVTPLDLVVAQAALGQY